MTIPMKGAMRALAIPAAVAIAAPAAAQEAAGDWLGVLEPQPGTRLPLVIRIKRDDKGTLAGTMDSPRKASRGWRSPTSRSRPEACPSPCRRSAAATRRWDAAARAWNGEWRQAGGRLRRTVEMVRGRHALIERSRDFTLVPWQPVQERYLGKNVAGIVRESGVNSTIERQRSGPSVS